MNKISAVLLLLLIIMLIGCSSKSKPIAEAIYDTPEWAGKAIWYQIFVERFHNGDPSNDPTRASCEGALDAEIPLNWAITPWGHDWYQQESWAKETGLDFYRTVQMRRYGGDLQGVMDKIPYFKELGINAIYFNPINDAPSLHKYDARNYHHVDINFGPDPQGDLKIIQSEDPQNPETWLWTSADKLFLELIDSLHSNGIRVILDYSWNHTGRSFWAFKDILQNLDSSQFKDWYEGQIKKDSTSGQPYYDYHGWLHHKSLPEWKKVDTGPRTEGLPFEGTMDPGVVEHIFAVTRRWMDPYGDGQVHKGIGGMRLDVAEHVPAGFWREYRKFVREINPEFYLVGENWWKSWPHELMDAEPWVQGDIFDAVMHYQWYKIARGFFAGGADSVSVDAFYFKMDSLYQKYSWNTALAMMNLSASHDTPRLLTCFQNSGTYKHNCKPQENPGYQTGKPNEGTYDRVRLFLVHQFTFPGAPHIWAGDEMGMWGADDPDNRKPLWWQSLPFENETANSLSAFSYNQPVGFNQLLFDFYKQMTKLRLDNNELSEGLLKFHEGIHPEILAYERYLDSSSILVLFNRSVKDIALSLPEEYKNANALFVFNMPLEIEIGATINMKSGSALVLKKNSR